MKRKKNKYCPANKYVYQNIQKHVFDIGIFSLLYSCNIFFMYACVCVYHIISNMKKKKNLNNCPANKYVYQNIHKHVFDSRIFSLLYSCYIFFHVCVCIYIYIYSVSLLYSCNIFFHVCVCVCVCDKQHEKKN